MQVQQVDAKTFSVHSFATARAAVQVDHMMRVGGKWGPDVPSVSYTEVMASKTGTTDDGRDAWFVGADGRRLGTVWVGFDDNRKVGLIGSGQRSQLFLTRFNMSGEPTGQTIYLRD